MTDMTEYEDLCKEPILPNKGAAGIKLGIKTKIVKDLWGEPLRIEQISINNLHWEYKAVGLWFKSDKLDQIGIQAPYEGKTKSGIGIGSTRSEVEQTYGWLSWDGTWLINNPPFGIGFDFSTSVFGESRVVGIYIFRE
jgi:hypothetical protein